MVALIQTTPSTQHDEGAEIDDLETCSSAQGAINVVIGADGGSLYLLANHSTEPQFAVLLNDKSLVFIDEGPAIDIKPLGDRGRLQ